MTREFRMGGAIVGLTLLVASGCGFNHIEDAYGRVREAGVRSVNGLSVLAEMFEAAGHDVSVTRRISPRLSRYDVLVWAPDDFAPPSMSQRIMLENWLSRGNRTLVYIGRDFDALPLYWESIADRLPAEEQLDAASRRARALAEHEKRRLEVVERGFARWFVLERSAGPQRVTQLRSEHGWDKDINVAEAELYLDTRLLAPQEADAAAAAGGVTGGGADPADFQFLEPGDLEQQQSVPEKVETLLAAGDAPLVMRVRDTRWASSQILVVNNGSFLLNLPLVNREHRKLAARVIAACGPPADVAFVETDDQDRGVSLLDPKADYPTGLEALTVWPVGLILMHAVLVGLIACFVKFPIFGRPRESLHEGVGDFARHIDALGRLLERNGDEDYARDLLREYQRTEHHGSYEPRARSGRSSPASPKTDSP